MKLLTKYKLFEFKLEPLCTSKLHTYIIGHYNPPVRIIDLVSHTTYVVCVNSIYNSIYMAGPTSLKSTPSDRFFEKLFMAVFLELEPWLFV